MKNLMKVFLAFLCCILLMDVVLADDPPPPPGRKPLYLNLFLEGLYNTGNSNMNKAQDHDGSNPFDRYYGEIADRITVEIHDAGNYNTIIETVSGVNLLRNGQAVAYFSQEHSGAYYVTVKHRNHIETVSATTVSFAGTSANWDFTTAASQAYGSNQKLLGTGIYGIYGGDVDQDGVIDLSDRNIINNAYQNTIQGYIAADANGDGTVDLTDRNVVNNSYQSTITSILP